MNDIKRESEKLVTYVKSIILKYCPYVDDRLFILGNAKSSEIDIEINIRDNQTQVIFLFGNNSCKQSVPEQITIPYIIEFAKISEIIDFILGDHEYIQNINLYNNSIGLNFAINWTEESIKGISCGNIGLNLKFNNIELEKQYLYMLFQKYYAFLEKTPSFKRIKNEYINSAKQSYINTLDKYQLISLLSAMNENELKELLHNLDNDTFIKYTSETQPQPNVKKLKKNNNKCN